MISVWIIVFATLSAFSFYFNCSTTRLKAVLKMEPLLDVCTFTTVCSNHVISKTFKQKVTIMFSQSNQLQEQMFVYKHRN